jgi:thioredoxin reductase
VAGAGSDTAGAVIVAAGGKPQKLDVPGEAELAAATVSNMPSPSATASPWRAGSRGQR